MTDMSKEFRALVEAARRVSEDVGELVREVLETGLRAPLDREEARALLSKVLLAIRERAEARMDDAIVQQIDRDTEALLRRVEEARSSLSHLVPDLAGPSLALREHDGIRPRPVLPTPVFHGRRVPVYEGFVRTRDIGLWTENQRIDIHLNQFQQVHGRQPTQDEIHAIMLGTLSLPGLEEDDHFAIRDLARSIAVNGVRKPPIIDVQGTLLDGNRRVTACHFILASDEFDLETKKRVEWLNVWQLTEHATDDDREAVIVSLNFEPDHKQEWPEYVKARKVYEQWEGLLALEGRANPSPQRQKEIRQAIARKFALPTSRVTRYIGMVELANEFEEYHIVECKRDRYAVKHRAEKCFQYFAELGNDGRGGVRASLNEDEAFKALVYDLLYAEKFRNWAQIRELGNVSRNEEALAYFREANEQRDRKEAQRLVDQGIALAKTCREIERAVGGNKRVEVFTAWLVNAPVRIFRPGSPDSLTAANLGRLYDALKLVEGYLHPTERREGHPDEPDSHAP